MKKGFIISFEGMEGAGKTTQCDLLAKKLKKIGQKTVVVREPGGVKVSEQIRDVVLSPKNTEISTETEVLLFQAARAQLYAEIVLPSVQAGKAVLMDRTRDSSTIYQGVVRKVGVKMIEMLNDYSTKNTYPNITFLLDLPAKVGMKRRAAAGKLDRIELEGVGFQEKVCQAYLDFAKKDKKGRWAVLDGEQSIEDVATEVWRVMEKKLKFKS